jgi:hypothetical protein
MGFILSILVKKIKKPSYCVLEKIEEGVVGVKIEKIYILIGSFNPRAQWSYPFPPLPLLHQHTPLLSPMARHFSIYGLVHRQSIFSANRSVN